MIEVFFLMLAAVIVFPLIIFLPLGLTKRGKWYAAIGALLIGVLGVGAGELLVYWQAILLMLLFSILIGFLAEKQSGIYGNAEAINNHENVTGAPALVEVISQSVNTDSFHKNDKEHTIDLPDPRKIQPKIEEDIDFIERQQEVEIEDTPVTLQGYLNDIEKMLDFQQKSTDEEHEL
ncbi:hypothetical protein M3204_05390 [Mesobacillus subterraneus]|uniref:hypothetical protein n=1 Tax=Mesobacillus subterraneus TaxID=285983 RepID=UPI00203E471F|nr:hypothetical protein [Mesobacillus subterraneus]MCM3663826.1 hypothetical protein [Mesobacillus subterraneus]MCM3683587.1 hypothetical protein [Mesobacillus subterraneus]